MPQTLSPTNSMDSQFPFDTLNASATSLSRLLRAGNLTSVELVDIYLAQIERHNRKGRQLRAIISTAPRYHLFAIARRLDDERRAGKVRGPLHGLPVVVKDNIATDALVNQLDTTVGSYAFVGAKPRKAATVVERLTAKGLIVLGKANLSELCGLKSPEMMPGWSAVGGQTQSPFVARRLEKGCLIWDHTAPGGSSAGSAVAVAAGFAPLAIGTDTVGSLITPANRAALYALKPTVGEVPMDGVFALSRSFDAVGGMAKSASDLTFLMDAVMEPVGKELEHTPLRYRLFQVRSQWSGLRCGFVDPAIWKVGKDFSRLNADAEKYMVWTTSHYPYIYTAFLDRASLLLRVAFRRCALLLTGAGDPDEHVRNGNTQNTGSWSCGFISGSGAFSSSLQK